MFYHFRTKRLVEGGRRWTSSTGGCGATVPELIGDLVAHRARQRPDHDVVVFEHVRLSYGRLDDDANRLASSFAALGMARPATCAIQLPNCPEFVVTWIALTRLGVVEVPISTSLRGDLLVHQLRTAECPAARSTAADRR